MFIFSRDKSEKEKVNFVGVLTSFGDWEKKPRN